MGDPDRDGASTRVEIRHGCDPRRRDSDRDGMPDGFELHNRMSCRSAADAARDPDHDGLTNLHEYRHRTNPWRADTDGDGIPDGVELANGTNPRTRDSDRDGVRDRVDDCPTVADPGQRDADRDGRGDACDTDDDGDGLSDAEEVRRGTNPLVADSDGDGPPDGTDNCPTTVNADQRDTDGDGLGNACDSDDDGDGLSDADETAIALTDPLVADTDGNGTPDGAEPHVHATPALFPAFNPDVTDYVSRCQPAGGIDLRIAPVHGTGATLDSGPARSAPFRANVALTGGQALTFTLADGRGGTTAYHVRCLPGDFPAYSATHAGTPQSQWYIVTPTLAMTGPRPDASYVAIFDTDGVPVWWMRTASAASDAKLLPNGDLAWGMSPGNFDTAPEAKYEERGLDGTLVRTLLTRSGTVTNLHDLQPLPNGHYLMLSYVPRDGVDLSSYGGTSNATVLDAEIEEVDADRTVLWSWSSKDHIALSETGAHWRGAKQQLSDGRTAYDIVHMNSLEADGGSIVFSARHLDAVYKIDRATGAVQWKLGGSATPESLAIVGDGANADFGGQHDARVLGDGSLTLHDNGTGRDRAPRAMRFAIDPTAKTATVVEAVSDLDAPTSGCCGSARRLSGGNWVMSWGFNSLVTELTGDGTRVFRLDFANSLFSYRAVPVEPGVLGAASLRAGMDAMHPR